MFPAFPKIFAIGSRYISNIFDNEVQITEKIDGSQFIFGKINGKVLMRSKGAQLTEKTHEKMFTTAVEYIISIENKLPEGLIFYSEYLRTRRHNRLNYNKIPKNNLALFGVMDTANKFYKNSFKYAELLDIDHVPLLFQGNIRSCEELEKYMEYESYLGGVKVEGIVIKNFNPSFLYNGQPVSLMVGKYVSEEFKEINNKKLKDEKNNKSKLDLFIESFLTEARWDKAVQHLKEKGELLGDAKDIGKLIKEIHLDIEEEEEENIKQWLWSYFKNDIKKTAVNGFSKWYKNQLINNNFNNE